MTLKTKVFFIGFISKCIGEFDTASQVCNNFMENAFLAFFKVALPDLTLPPNNDSHVGIKIRIPLLDVSQYGFQPLRVEF